MSTFSIRATSLLLPILTAAALEGLEVLRWCGTILQSKINREEKGKVSKREK